MAAGFTAPSAFDAVAHFVGGLLGFGDGVAIRHRVVRGRQFLHRAVQLLAAGLVEVLQLGLLAHQFDFDLRALLLLSCTAARSPFSSSSPARSGLAHGGFLRGHLVDLRFQRR